MAPFPKHCVMRGCSAEPHFGRKREAETQWACGAHKAMIGFGAKPAETPPHPRVKPGDFARPTPTRGEGSDDLFAAAR